MSNITVSQLADWMGIDDSDDDTLLQAAIDSAQIAVNAWCGRSFEVNTNATARVFYTPDPYIAYVDDFQSSSGLIVQSDMGDTGTYDTTWTATTDYTLEPNNNYSDGVTGWPYYKICAVGSRYFPTGSMGSRRRPRLQVVAKWGWAAIPAAVVEATYIKAARLFRRKDAPETSGGFEAGGFSVPLIRVSVREDPDVIALLAPYVRTDHQFVAG